MDCILDDVECLFLYNLPLKLCACSSAFLGPVAGGALIDNVGFAWASFGIGSVTIASVSLFYHRQKYMRSVLGLPLQFASLYLF